MPYVLSGVCRDFASVPVPGAVVKVFDTATDTLQGVATADGSGVYSVDLAIAGPLYAVGYSTLYGVFDIAGTTINTLVATLAGTGTGGTPIGLLLALTTASGPGVTGGQPTGLLLAITTA
jgi:hypothetical protein